MKTSSLAFILVLLAVAVKSAEPRQKELSRTLVLLDNYAYYATHSRFFSELQSVYSRVDIRMLNSPDYTIKEFGEYNYENLVLLCTSETGSDPSIPSIYHFNFVERQT